MDEGESGRETVIREFFDGLRGKLRKEAMPTDFIERFGGPIIGAVDSTLASFTAGAGVTAGTFADIYDLSAYAYGIIEPQSYVYLKDRRRGTIDAWFLGTSPGARKYVDLHAPSFAQPLYSGLQGTVVLGLVAAATGTFYGRMRAFVDHDGTESFDGGGV